MKQFKFPALFLAMAIAVLSAFAANVKTAEKSKFATTYYYSPTEVQDIAHLSDPLNWSNAGTMCNPTGNDVCTIDFNGNRTAFNAYISSFASQTKADVLAVASSKKN